MLWNYRLTRRIVQDAITKEFMKQDEFGMTNEMEVAEQDDTKEKFTKISNLSDQYQCHNKIEMIVVKESRNIEALEQETRIKIVV